MCDIAPDRIHVVTGLSLSNYSPGFKHDRYQSTSPTSVAGGGGGGATAPQ